MHFHTVKTTTDNLGAALDTVAGPDALRVTQQYLGGRDWLVIAEHRDHGADATAGGTDDDLPSATQRLVTAADAVLRPGYESPVTLEEAADRARAALAAHAGTGGSEPVMILVKFECPAFGDRDERIDQLASRIGEVVRETTGVDLVEFPIGPTYLRPLTKGTPIGDGDSITTRGPEDDAAEQAQSDALAELLRATDAIRQGDTTQETRTALFAASDRLRRAIADSFGGTVPPPFRPGGDVPQ